MRSGVHRTVHVRWGKGRCSNSIPAGGEKKFYLRPHVRFFFTFCSPHFPALLSDALNLALDASKIPSGILFFWLLIKSLSVFWFIALPSSTWTLYFHYSDSKGTVVLINLYCKVLQCFCATDSLTPEYKPVLYILTNTVATKPFGSLSKRVSALQAHEKLLYNEGISHRATQFSISPQA